MIQIQLYFFSYFLIYLGFILGKSTKEEHSEIKKIVLFSSKILKSCFYIICFYIFVYEKIYLSVFLILFVLFLLINVYKKDSNYAKLIDVISFGFFLIFTANSQSSELMKHIHLVVLLLFAMIFDNSFEKFDKIEELRYFVIYSLILGFSYFF